MMKLLVFIVSGVVGFLIAFSFTASDDIGAEVDKRLDEDFVEQCVARAQFPAQLKPQARSICGCMKGEFDRKGLTITDAFGARRSEMQQVTRDCAAIYS